MRFKAYDLISRAVDDGISIGYTRAHKHTDEPGEVVIKDAIFDAVMNSIAEILILDEID